MGTRRVAPPTIVVRKSVIRRAEIGGGNGDGRATRVAPPWVIGALDFKARAAAQPFVEQRRAERRRVDSVSLAVQISVPTSTSCKIETKLIKP